MQSSSFVMLECSALLIFLKLYYLKYRIPAPLARFAVYTLYILWGNMYSFFKIVERHYARKGLEKSVWIYERKEEIFQDFLFVYMCVWAFLYIYI